MATSPLAGIIIPASALRMREAAEPGHPRTPAQEAHHG
jgi:hypothetical protein